MDYLDVMSLLSIVDVPLWFCEWS